MPTLPFRASATGRTANGGGFSCSVVIPSTVQPGDFLLAGYLANSQTTDTGGQGVIAAPTGVTGWTPVHTPQLAVAGQITQLWSKIAGSGDAGSTVVFSYTTDTFQVPQAAAVVAWENPNPAAPIAVSATAVSAAASASHVMPIVDTSADGTTLIISVWLGRTPAASPDTALTPLTGWTARAANLDSAGSFAHAEICVIDSTSPVAAGTGQGGATITGTQSATYNCMYTIALAPVPPTATARPVTDVTTASWTPSATLGGGVQMATLVADSDDTTYLTSQAGPVSQVLEELLPTMSGPPDTVTARIRCSSGASSATIVTQLIQGTTVIATRTDTYASAPPTSFVNLVLTLTGTQQAAISDLTNLRIRVTVTAA
jgi:hypothetical protein